MWCSLILRMIHGSRRVAWMAEHGRAADRCGLQYPSDLTDAEWALMAPLIRPAKHGSRPRKVDMREVLNTVFYALSTGFHWSALPKDCRRRAQCGTTSRVENGKALSSASILPCKIIFDTQL
jgi:hypothetical protein